jgi:hypothetical protein
MWSLVIRSERGPRRRDLDAQALPKASFSDPVPRQMHQGQFRPTLKKLRKLIPLNLHVSLMLNSTRYCRTPLGVPLAPITLRSRAKALIACSALLLFHGTPSWSRNVNSLSWFFSNRFLYPAATRAPPRLARRDPSARPGAPCRIAARCARETPATSSCPQCYRAAPHRPVADLRASRPGQ